MDCFKYHKLFLYEEIIYFVLRIWTYFKKIGEKENCVFSYKHHLYKHHSQIFESSNILKLFVWKIHYFVVPIWLNQCVRTVCSYRVWWKYTAHCKILGEHVFFVSTHTTERFIILYYGIFIYSDHVTCIITDHSSHNYQEINYPSKTRFFLIITFLEHYYHITGQTIEHTWTDGWLGPILDNGTLPLLVHEQ